MPLHITNLPLELLWEITRNVISKEDLCQLRSVNSLFETLATPEVFNSVTVRNNKQSADRFSTLLLTSRIASHIQSISFVEDLIHNTKYALAGKEVWKRLEVAFSSLHQAPGLKTLELHFCPYFKNLYDDPSQCILRTEYLSHQWDIVYALGSNRNPLPALQSLKIHEWVCGEDDDEDELMLLFDEAPIGWLVASLRHLTIIIPGMTSTRRTSKLEPFWKQVIVRRLLQPAVNLESLVITGRCPDARCPATFPQLAALSLRHMIWEDDASGQGIVPLEFIVCHQKTLKKLELHNCRIKVRKIDVRRKFEPPHYYWADIYKRLANALTGLVELKVEFKLAKDEIPYVYCYGSHPPSYNLKKNDLKGSALDAALAPDALALEEFRAVVKSQGMAGCSGFRP